MMPLVCPVRGCRDPLVPEGRTLTCARRHAFDLARSGYVNLLQPHERRSKHPGDAPATVAARRRFLERGFEAPLIEALRDLVPSGARVLDAGCGEGFLLRALAAGRDLHACGVDISAPAVDAAAKLQPDATFVVANADRVMPFADAAFDALLSVNARLNPPEFRRLLAPSGLLLVVVPAAPDLRELRAAVLGQADARDRMLRVRRELSADFVEAGSREVTHVVRMDAAALQDALAMTYRGARKSQQENVAALGEMDVTLSHDVSWWTPLPPERDAADQPGVIRDDADVPIE